MPRDEQRNVCSIVLGQKIAVRKKKSLICYDHILFPFPRQANRKAGSAM